MGPMWKPRSSNAVEELFLVFVFNPLFMTRTLGQEVYAELRITFTRMILSAEMAVERSHPKPSLLSTGGMLAIDKEDFVMNSLI